MRRLHARYVERRPRPEPVERVEQRTCLSCHRLLPLHQFMRRGRGIEVICYACRERGVPYPHAEARRLTFKRYELHRPHKED